VVGALEREDGFLLALGPAAGSPEVSLVVRAWGELPRLLEGWDAVAVSEFADGVVLSATNEGKEVVLARGGAVRGLEPAGSLTDRLVLEVSAVAVTEARTTLAELVGREENKDFSQDWAVGGGTYGCGLEVCSVTCGPQTDPQVSSCSVARVSGYASGVGCFCSAGLAHCVVLDVAACR
jgi:hypothetical protein